MRTFIEKNLGLCLVFFFVWALMKPSLFLPLKDGGDELIMLMMFFGFLKVQFNEIFHLKQNLKKLCGFIVLTLVIIPFIFWWLSPEMSEDLRLSLFLLLATSGATVTPILASFFGLKVLWTMGFVIFSSLVLPFTLPFLTDLLFGISVPINMLEMMVFLSKTIFIPALLAYLVRRYWSAGGQKISQVSGVTGVIGMGLFIACVTARNQSFLMENFFSEFAIKSLLWIFGLNFLLFLIGFFMSGENQEERWSNALMFGNRNNGIIILLAAQFFSPAVLLIALLSEIPWVTAQFVFPWVKQKLYK